MLSDGDIGPTASVDVSDPDQVQRFFVWHRDNGTVTLEYHVNFGTSFNVSYIDIYTLTLPSARIGSPGTIRFTTPQGPVNNAKTQSCTFSSTTNTLSRNGFTIPHTDIIYVEVIFEFSNQDIDWLFISEIQLCAGDPPSSISCDSSTTDTPAPTPAISPSPTPLAPPITLSSRPTVTPDLSQPDSVMTITPTLISVVVTLAVLLFISLTINILGMIHCVYQWRVKQAQSVGEGENKEQLYEQVDERPHPTGDVTLKQNEAYGQIQLPNPTPTTAQVETFVTFI